MTSSAATIKIKNLFIANRGEICRRIAMTAKRLGVETATVSDASCPPAYLTQVIDRSLHRHGRRPQDVPPVDLADGGGTHTHERRSADDVLEQSLANVSRQLLRVIGSLDEGIDR